MNNADNAQQLISSLVTIVREKQQFMTRITELQQRMAVTLQQQQTPLSSQQQTIIYPSPCMCEYLAEGIYVPKFYRPCDDDVADYMFSERL